MIVQTEMSNKVSSRVGGSSLPEADADESPNETSENSSNELILIFFFFFLLHTHTRAIYQTNSHPEWNDKSTQSIK